ncbi:MAG: hypothetical protein AB8H80_06240 [Planctomycetota bacterium]
MTLPNEDVRAFLQDHFVLAYKNIEKEKHVGVSHGYKCTQDAVGTTNGAGGRNVQFFVLAADTTVLHCMPGFWHAEDLIKELQLALEVDRLYRTQSMSADRKGEMYELLHGTHLRRHGPEMDKRGYWQSFDQSYEMQRAQREIRDTVATDSEGKRSMRPLVTVLHNRMVSRRFQKFEDFDIESFVDYGRPFYDNNRGKGRRFARAESNQKKRAKAAAKKRKKARRRSKTEKWVVRG